MRNDPSSSKYGRFWQLVEKPDYPEIRTHRAQFVHAITPSPLQTSDLVEAVTPAEIFRDSVAELIRAIAFLTAPPEPARFRSPTPRPELRMIACLQRFSARNQ